MYTTRAQEITKDDALVSELVELIHYYESQGLGLKQLLQRVVIITT